jgi:tetratricopeptide (TPR) repeat protein
VYVGVTIGIISLRIIAGYAVKMIEKYPILEHTAFMLVGYVGLMLLVELQLHVHFDKVVKFIGIVALSGLSILYSQKPGLRAVLLPVLRVLLLRGSIAFQNRDYTATREALTQCVAVLEKTNADPQQPPADSRVASQAYFLLAVLAENDKDYVQANQYLDKLSGPEDQRRVSQRRVQMLVAQGQLDAAAELVRAMPDNGDEEARAKISAEVELLRARKDEEGAYRLLSDAMERFPKDPDMAYEAAMSADKLKNVVRMEQILRKLIASAFERLAT